MFSRINNKYLIQRCEKNTLFIATLRLPLRLGVKYFPALILLLIAGTSFAQQKNTHATPKHLQMVAIAKGYEDSVVIRWAPASPEAWILGNEAGYHITRVDISDTAHPVRTDLGQQLLLPMQENQLLTSLDTTDEKTKYLTVAEKMLYGKQYSTSRMPARSFMQQVKNEHGALVLRYMLAMMAADYYPPAADVLALRWVDKQVKKGGRYVYLITSPVKNQHYAMDSAAVFVINEKIRKEPAPQGLEAYGYDRKVELRWNRRQNGYFSGYYIERSDDNGKTYHVLNSTPFNSIYVPPTGDKKKDSLLAQSRNTILRDQQVYDDSIAQDYKTYYYRLRAINGFGELSPYTQSIVIQGHDLTPPVPPLIDSIKNIRGNQVKIWWTQHNASPDLAGYYVDKGSSAQGPFHTITPNMLGKQITTFIDTTAVSHQANYYVLIAVDSAKNIAASLPALAYLTDTLPPSAPAEIAGTIDSGGIVQLRWKRNTEPDLLGYQVYASYNPDYAFSQITHQIISDTVFTDTVSMQSLDRQVYYRVVALDRNYNHSPFSATAALKKPVVIPPSAPVAGAVSVNGKQATIEWIESHGQGVTGYQIYRKEKDQNWQPMAKLSQDWTTSSVYFTDTTLALNTDYYYAAETIDSSGLRSARSFAVHVRSSAAGTAPAPGSLQAVYDQQQRIVKLSWQYGDDAGDYFFVVCRSVNNGPLTAWQSFEKSDHTGADHPAVQGAYQYAIKVVYRDKPAASALSEPVTVTVPH